MVRESPKHQFCSTSILKRDAGGLLENLSAAVKGYVVMIFEIQSISLITFVFACTLVTAIYMHVEQTSCLNFISL